MRTASSLPSGQASLTEDPGKPTTLGIAIGWLIGVLNVRHVLLVGRVASFGDEWLGEVRRYARSSVLALVADDTQIEFGHVHDDVVVLGASALLMEQQLGLGLVR